MRCSALIGCALLIARGADSNGSEHKFVDREHGFSFLYPSDYSLETKDSLKGLGSSFSKGRRVLARLIGRTPRHADATDTDNCSIDVQLLPGVFNLQSFIKEAPTGVITPPEPVHFGANTFYYYGPGGGGVAYSDVYYFNLHGRALEIVFDGPYNGTSKSPDERAQSAEKLVLSTFHVGLR